MDQEKQNIKIYSAEFRESSVKLALESEKAIAQTAKDLGVNANTLHTWINKYSQPKEPNKTVRTDEHLYEELKQTAAEKNDVELTEVIKALFKKSRRNYGTRRLKEALINKERQVSRRRIGRLMEAAGLACKTKRKFKATTNSKHNQPIAPNHLDRQFTMKRPNQAYVGDITYVHTQVGWLYLAVVIDLFSRQVVGWSMADHMRTQLVNDALLMALWKRKPDKGLWWHTDRGSQYASESHRALLTQYGIQQSMSRKGNCWDNGVPRRRIEGIIPSCSYAA